ncbi:oxidoreductase [Candidatus Atribacteria bacterium HGW-Atribacteria-1]|nr:MAG: oxidoreductase [Candidatus Atribacteria bacterium HGW-Atribacteria-1]
MHKLKFAIIGCGYISTNHIRAIIDNFEDAELISVCDLLKNRAELKADEYVKKAEENHLTVKRPTVFNDYREMLKKENIDICAICTISGYRTKISLYCMELKKSVLVEKPMAMSTMDADRMIKTAEKNKVKLAVCYQNRFRPTIQKLRQAIDEGSFGRIIAGTARILWNRNRDYYERAKWRGTWKLDGGCLMNQCTHNIDLLQWLMGSEIDTVFGQIANYLHPYNETEDYGSIIIRFKNGSIGNIEGTVCVYPKNLEETLTILGEKGTAVIGGLALNEIITWDFEDKKESLKEVQQRCNLEIENIYGKGHTPLYKNFIDSIKSNNSPLIDGYEGKKSLSIVLMAYKSQKYSRVINYNEGLNISTKDFEGMFDEKN